MKILLVLPNFDGRAGMPAINLALIKSYIQQKSVHKALIFDPTFTKQNARQKLLNVISKEKPDIIGMSVLSFDYMQAVELSDFIKAFYPGIKIIFGGIHTTLTPEATLKNNTVDLVCIGEGEKALVDLLDSSLDPKGIYGIWYKDGEKIIQNEPRPLNQDLDSLPYLDFDDYDLDKYFMVSNYHLPLMVSRGCPYNCTFCNNHALKKILSGKYVRFKSVDKVLDEIGHCIHKYYDMGFRGINFLDDIFILNKHWTAEFCKKYKERGYDKIIKWNVSVRANLVTEEVITQLKDAGCYEVGMGIEAGSDYIRNQVYKRDMTRETIDLAVQIIKRSGLLFRLQFIIGAPYETIEMMNESLEMAKRIDGDVVQFPILMPLPGTEIEEICRKEGLIEKSSFMNAQIMYTSPVMRTKYASSHEIKKFYQKVRNYQIKKYLKEGFKRKGGIFLWDMLRFFLYFMPKYKLEIQNAFKMTINKYNMLEIFKNTYPPFSRY